MRKKLSTKEKIIRTILVVIILFLFVELFDGVEIMYFPIIATTFFVLCKIWVKYKPKTNKKANNVNKDLLKKEIGEVYSFRVAGSQYYKSNVQKMIKEFEKNNLIGTPYDHAKNKNMSDFYHRIYRYKPTLINAIQFIPDPDNKFDSKAVKVYGGVDEKNLFHIGYIPEEETYIFHDFTDKINSISITILGGPYKTYDDEEERIIEKLSDFIFEVTIQMELS